MAKLDDEHRGAVQTVEYKDFSGGINTAKPPELIEINELARAINVEIDSTSGSLKTVAGLDVVISKTQAEGVTFQYLLYDSIGNTLLVTDNQRKVFALTRNSAQQLQLTEVGQLDGEGTVEYTAWEDGVVITSGGKLQYYHDGTLETISDANAPTACHCPFIKDGRIYLAEGDELHCSAVGNEHGWTEDTNDASSAKWLQVGYKDGGKIVGLGALASDMVIFKDNNRAYHLAGQYPNWQLSEIGRQIDCKGFDCCVTLADQVLALGRQSLQTIRVTDQYGDMRSANVSAKVQKEIALMGRIKLRYMPSLNQIWMINGTKRFFFLDMNNGGFFQREFYHEVHDAVEAGGNVYVLRDGKLYKLNSTHMNDGDIMMKWRIQGKTMTTINQFLVKRAWVDTTPSFDNYIESIFMVDKVPLLGAVPRSAMCIYHDYTHIFSSNRGINVGVNYTPMFVNSDEVYNNPEYLWLGDSYIKGYSMYRSQLRQIDRNNNIKLQGYGAGGAFLINSINYIVAEV